MANANKVKGDHAETVVRNHYRLIGFPFAERTRAGYTRDAGDLHVSPGAIVQVKNCRMLQWTEWFVQLARQKLEAKASIAWLVVKRPGMGDTRVGEWLVVMTVDEHAKLVRAAGYGEPLERKSEFGPEIKEAM